MYINHERDEEDYVKSLNEAYEEYRSAFYSGVYLPPTQIRETKQSFLSGIYWLAKRENYCPDDLEVALRTILGNFNQNAAEA